MDKRRLNMKKYTTLIVIILIIGCTDTSDRLDNLESQVERIDKRLGTTGWGFYEDTVYTKDHPLVIYEGDTVGLRIKGGARIESELPGGFTTLWADSLLLPQLSGSAFDIRVSFISENTSSEGYFAWGLGIPNIIPSTTRTFTFPKGAGREHRVSQTTAIFSGNAFLKNGGKIVCIGGEGTTRLYDPSIMIKLDVSSKNNR